MQHLAAVVQDRPDAVLRALEQHGLALHHHHHRPSHPRYLCCSLRHLYFPGIVRPFQCRRSHWRLIPHLSIRPKFLLAKGHDEEAIDVLYKIATFNKQPAPTLTIDDFRLLDKEYAEDRSIHSDDPLNEGAQRLNAKELTKTRMQQLVGQVKHLKGLFATKRAIWTSISLWIAYVSSTPHFTRSTSS